MSHLPGKTNYVRPHVKASFIRPFCGYDKTETMEKDSFENFKVLKCPLSPVKGKGSFDKSDCLKSMEQTKENHLLNLNTAHSKLQSEMEKIQTWKLTVDAENKQKNKKVEELTQTVESQRKVVLDLQMHNENLSSQLGKEMQERVAVLEKFGYIKEMFLILKKKFNDLQKQLNECDNKKKTIDICREEHIKAIEDLTKEFNAMTLECSEKIAVLSNALKSEKQNSLIIKQLCEQQNLHAEKEHKQLCKLIENYQEELKNYCKDLEAEKNTSVCLEQEKSNMAKQISDLENIEEINKKKLKEMEEELNFTVEKKLEIENNYASEKEEVNSLTLKCEELEELITKQKVEFDESCIALKTFISSLENSLAELKQKFEESQRKIKQLMEELQKTEKDKCSLEKEISDKRNEIKTLENKSIIDAKVSDEAMTQLMKEKSVLNSSLITVKEELSKALSEKENLSEVCLEKDRKFSELNKDYKELSALKIAELKQFKLKYDESLRQLKELEDSAFSKSKELESKELDIAELKEFKLKYKESLEKIKELEESVFSKSEELQSKNKKLNELSALEEKLIDASNKNKDLEQDLSSKAELLFLKEQVTEELQKIKEDYTTALNKIKELEVEVNHTSSLLGEEKAKVMDLRKVLREKELKIETLEYDNFVIKDILEKEKESTKICLECEEMKDQIKELDCLKDSFANIGKELELQKQQKLNITRMLSETEENFDKMRIKKETEIIKCNDTIQSLQHEMKILEVEVAETDKLRYENERLQGSIEEINLQNAGDIQRLKTENMMLKNEMESLKAKNDLPVPKEKTPLNKNLSQEMKSQEKYESILKEKPLTVSDLCKAGNDNEKMEADSSSVKMITEINKPSIYRNVREINRRVQIPRQQAPPRTPLVPEKRKRTWDCESSSVGSDCIQVVFDKDENMAFTPKHYTPKGPMMKACKTPVPSTPRVSLTQNKRRDITLQTPKIQSPKLKFAPSRNGKLVRSNYDDNEFFLSAKRDVKETLENSPWNQKISEIKATPSTAANRKFFKTPIKEREWH